MGAIADYPAQFNADNVNPNITYYVGVFGIGNADQYSIAATLDPAVRSCPRQPPSPHAAVCGAGAAADGRHPLAGQRGGIGHRAGGALGQIMQARCG